MPNILYIADIDPKSHNLKWIFHFSQNNDFRCFITCLHHQYHSVSEEHLNFLEGQGLKVLPPVGTYSMIKFWNTFKYAFQLRKVVREYQIEVIHIMYAEPNALWSNWKWLFKTPMVLTTRGTDVLKTIPFFASQKSLFYAVLMRHYKSAFVGFDEITCTSRLQAETILSWCSRCNPQLVRTGVKLEALSDIDEGVVSELGIKGPFILMPRSMYPVYNHEFTVEALKLLPGEVKSKFSFVFLNRDSSDIEYTRSIQGKLDDLDAKVIFLDTLNNDSMVSLVKESTLVVMNPRSDGSPVTAMEAMACYVPIIMPPLSYDKDLFGEGVFYFDRWDPVCLANKMVQVLQMESSSIKEELAKAYHKILSSGNFLLEMDKIKRIYSRLTPSS